MSITAIDIGIAAVMGLAIVRGTFVGMIRESFSVAACDEEFALRAHEMWGITLQRASNPDESVRVLTEGLTFAESRGAGAVLRGSSRVRVSDCVFTNLGGDAVVVEESLGKGEVDLGLKHEQVSCVLLDALDAFVGELQRVDRHLVAGSVQVARVVLARPGLGDRYSWR